MPISEPSLKPLPVSKDQVIWPPVWGSFFTQVFQALFGWRRTFYASLTHDFGSIATQAQATQTVTVTGARSSGSNVSVTAETPTSGIIVDGYVSAADTVTIRAHNYTSGAVDPAESVYNVIVYQQQ